MNKAKLSKLELVVSSGLNNFQDLGFVNSVKETENKIYKKYKLKDINYGLDDNQGLFLPIKNKKKYDLYIFYIKSKKEIINTFIRGHEETHALVFLEKLESLEKKLWEEQRVKVDFSKIEEEEISADIGGFFAVYQNYFELQDFFDLDKHRMNSCGNSPEWYKKAKDIYELSKIPVKYFDFGERNG